MQSRCTGHATFSGAAWSAGTASTPGGAGPAWSPCTSSGASAKDQEFELVSRYTHEVD